MVVFRFILLLLNSGCAHLEYGFEKSKFAPGTVCEGILGVWHTDVYASKTSGILLR